MNINHLYYCGYLVGKLCENAIFKALVAIALIVFHFMFDSLQSMAMLAVLMLIMIDFITGIVAAYQTGAKIESHTALRSAIKTVIYFMLISAGFIAEKAVPLSVLDDTVIAFLAATELISVLENAGKMGYAVPKKLLNILKEFNNK